MNPKAEIADIIRLYGSDFYLQHNVLDYHKRVLNALENCRTAALGGHVERCDSCGAIRISYNSCRNRFCPKCQGSQRNRWISSRLSEVLDCTYFHTVFTIPVCLNSFCLRYPKEMYNLLFKSSKDTLVCFGRDKQYLGAEIGCIGILHTWGQQMDLHPHIHYIVPGGGIDSEGNWRHTRSEGKYLFPVKALSTVFRGRFVALLKHFLHSKGIEFTAELRHALYKNDWVVYAEHPFGGAVQVIEYLGRYTHKIAISNHRIQSISDGKVVFNYKDYVDGGKVKTMTLSALEFLRRFCMHILPKGLRKIRYYGFLASRNKNRLRELQIKMRVAKLKREPEPEAELKKDAIVYIRPDFKVRSCPCCGRGEMHVIMRFGAHAPPSSDMLTVLNNRDFNNIFH